MKGAWRPWRVGCCAAMALAVASAGCRRAEEPDAAVAEETSTSAVDASPTPLPPGRHALTASPPITPTELDRLLGLGFTPDEVLAEIERRGVLKRIEGADRTHVLSLPRGERMLEAMDAPANLLSVESLARYGHRLAGINLEQGQINRENSASDYNYYLQTRMQSQAVRNQQQYDYQRRSNDLKQRITALKRKRTEMQRRGEMIVSITIEIERLEREAAALTPPE